MKGKWFYSFQISASELGNFSATYLDIKLYDYLLVFIHENPKFKL